MNRLGLLEPSTLNPEQKQLYDRFYEYTEDRYGTKFITKLQDGTLVGPFGIQLHTPAVGQQFLSFTQTLAKLPGLTQRVREVAIMVVGSRTHAAYEHYAHAVLSGFSQKGLEDIEKGVCPEEFDEEQKAAFLVATELGKSGPLSQAAWDKGEAVLGRDGLTALIHYVGFYNYVATILNGFDAKVPE